MGIVAAVVMLPSVAAAAPKPRVQTLTAKAAPSPIVFGQSTVVS